MTMKMPCSPTDSTTLNNRRGRFVQVFGRMKPGMTIEQAKAGLQPLFHQILQMEVQEKEFAKRRRTTRRQQFLRMWMDVLPGSKGRSNLREQFSKPLLALMAIVGLVLLIACSNVANLLIARATAAAEGNRRASGAGRQPRPPDPAIAGREPAALDSPAAWLGVGLAVVDRPAR